MPAYKLPPKLTYCGLTIVMSNPSRFDMGELLSANGGFYFRNECLRPEHNLMQCEVRLKEDRTPFLPNTKSVLLLGKPATELWLGNTTNTLGEIRGSVYLRDNIPHIPSYLPQDACDFKDHESSLNEHLLGQKDYAEDNVDLRNSIKAEKRRHGVTARSNWKFWLRADVKKAIRLLHNGGKIPDAAFVPNYIIYPNSEEIIRILLETKNEHLYLDIETDESLNIKCIGLSFSSSNDIFVVPLLDFNYRKAYENLGRFIRALSIAISNNILVSHNGSCFDWIILAWRYGIPIGHQFYDTMLAQHRIFPSVEKSLGHTNSYWTYEPFHKDEGTGAYNTNEDMLRLLKYCGKDIYTMRLIHLAQMSFAKTIPGLEASIAQANRTVRPYITMTLQGIHYKQEYLDDIVKENDLLCNQYLRMLRILIGEDNLRTIRGTGKDSMPSSNVQCCRYFHDMLDYPIVLRSPKTGKPSLGKKAMYRLRLKHENPVIDLCLLYREAIKETGSLKFLPWLTN